MPNEISRSNLLSLLSEHHHYFTLGLPSNDSEHVNLNKRTRKASCGSDPALTEARGLLEKARKVKQKRQLSEQTDYNTSAQTSNLNDRSISSDQDISSLFSNPRNTLLSGKAEVVYNS